MDEDNAEEDIAPGRRSATRNTLLLGLAAVAAFLLAAVLTTWLTADGPPEATTEPTTAAAALIATPTPLDERIAPADEAPLPASRLDGFAGAEPVELSAYRGEPLIVNFWASWCAPCVEEIPDFEAFAQAHPDQALLGVNVKDAPSNAEAFAEDLGISYDLAVDPEGALFTEVSAFAMPTTLFVDAEGTIVHRQSGFMTGEQLEHAAETHLGVE